MSILANPRDVIVQGTMTAIQNQTIYNGQVVEAQEAQGFEQLHRYYSTAALFDALAHSEQPKCLKGTRETIIKEVMDWVQGKEKWAAIYWLKGPAGAGKSALEYTIAALCMRKGLFIAGFAFSRTAVNRNDGDMLIPTLAIQLARAIPDTRDIIDRTLKANLDIFERSRETQLRLLIVDPLRQLWANTRLQDLFRRGWRYPTVIAIDGLDECSDHEVQCDILESIGAVVRDLDFPLRFFIASRPEAHISQMFDKLQSDTRVRLSYMYLGEDAAATRDIQTYLEVKFQEIRKSHPHLPETWPSNRVISQLVEKASGQFIYVSTVMAYLSSIDDNPDARLQVILQLSRPPTGDNPFSQLDLLYSHILHSAKNRATTLQILGCLILPKSYYSRHGFNFAINNVREFNSPIVLEALFGFERGHVRRLMSDLLSLVTIENDDEPMKVLHASLGDFLLDESRSGAYFVIADKICAILARKCVDYISGFKCVDLDFKNVELFICPSIALCMWAGLSDKLNDVLRKLDIPSAYLSLIYSSPTQFNSTSVIISKLSSCLDREFRAGLAAYIWTMYTCDFQPTRGKVRSSPKDIFIIITGPWQDIKAAVSDLSAKKAALPDHPIAGQVRFQSPRECDDPAIILVLVPTRPAIPEFVARVLDKRIMDTSYGVERGHGVYRVSSKDHHKTPNFGQERAWRSLWRNARILDGRHKSYSDLFQNPAYLKWI